MTYRHQLHGLRIESGIELPEPQVQFAGSPDLRFRLGDRAPVPRVPDDGLALRAWLTPERVRYEGFRAPDGAWVIRVPDLVEISVLGDQATVQPGLEVDPALLPMFSAGMGLALFLASTGELCLHASAVEAGGRGIGLSAPSGFGKSTLAALAAASGYPLVGDDILRVAFDDPVPAVYRGASEIRLRSGAAALVQHWPDHSRLTADGRTAVAPPLTEAERLPLAAMVFPALERERTEIAIEQLRPSDAIVPLLACPRLVGWVDLEVVGRQFEQLATIAADVPVLVARVPWRTPAGPDIGAALIEAVLAAC